jgi:hypothetical protein
MDMEENGEEDLNQPRGFVDHLHFWSKRMEGEEQIGRSRDVGRQKEKRRIGTTRARPRPPRSYCYTRTHQNNPTANREKAERTDDAEGESPLKFSDSTETAHKKKLAEIGVYVSARC